jgi:polyisoprenoid-binding protein YceI
MRRAPTTTLASVAFLAACIAAAPPPATAQTLTARLDSTASELHYTGRHPSHSWRGSSGDVRGRVAIDTADPSESEVALRVAVESFDSGNGNRDSNMLDVLDADRYTHVSFVSDSIRVDAWRETASGYAGSWTVFGDLTFRGVTHGEAIPVDVRIEDGVMLAGTEFEVSLIRYDVPRPRLLFVPVREFIRLDGTLRATLR